MKPLRLIIPHPFKNHDHIFRVRFDNPFYFIPWYSRVMNDSLSPDDIVIDNYAGWGCIAVHWYSTKDK